MIFPQEFTDIIESVVNGQLTQAKEQFNELSNTHKVAFLNYLTENIYGKYVGTDISSECFMTMKCIITGIYQ